MGCVIAEMYMDGEGPFDLPALLAYRACPSDSAADAFLTQRISKIADPVVHVSGAGSDEPPVSLVYRGLMTQYILHVHWPCNVEM